MPALTNGRTHWGRVARLVAIPLVFVLTSGVAWAYWTADGVGSGASAATSFNPTPATAPTTIAAGANVTVAWTASYLTSLQAVSGYVVRRYDAAGVISQTLQPGACTGTVTALSCTEIGVPAGQWVYSVTPALGTNWRGPESAKSAMVTSDPNAPSGVISLSVLSGNAFQSNTNTIYYRGSIAGAFRLTNTVTDAGSGPASATFPDIATSGWTHPAETVTTGIGSGSTIAYSSTTYSLTNTAGVPTSQPIVSKDAAGNTAATSLSFINDSTPPAGTIDYPNNVQDGRSVTVTFAASDSGSGIASSQLQRSYAPLDGGVCGGFSSFANLGATNPTSPYTDSQVTNAICYKYQYVMTDQVQNQGVATIANANVAKVDYGGIVSANPSLLSYWRLGESATSSYDSFTEPSGTLLTSHVGEKGATWVNGSSTNNLNTETITSNRAYRTGSGYSLNYTTATAPTADYSVSADVFVKSVLPLDGIGVVGRLTGAGTGTTGYMARWDQVNTSWNIIRFTDTTATYLKSVVNQQALTAGATYRVRLEMNGATTTVLNLYVNDVLMTTYTDTSSPLTAIGRAGIRDGIPGGTVIKDANSGLQFGNFQVTPAIYPRAVDSMGSNTGTYLNRPTLGVTGAIAGDSNTAAQFDGVSDYVQAVTTTAGIPLGGAARSVEMWFKTTSAARQVLFNYGKPAAGQEFGLWLNAGGLSMTTWGWGGGNDKVFTLPGAVNNGAWHQVAETYDGTSITIYIDGVALPSQTVTLNTAMDSNGFGIGAVIMTGDTNSGGYFNGSLDEVSFYATVLHQPTISNHFQLGTSPAPDVIGPAGGSVDAGGLRGTGSRYATSTTLSLNLNKGTDPSGVAATGAQLLRASAALTSQNGTLDGTCGAFGSYTLVTSGADPVSPKSDAVADEACYSYRYVVADMVGNPTTYTSPAIKVDTTTPTVPTLAFSALTNTYASGAGSTLVYYRSTAIAPATGSFTVTASSTDLASGITSYAFPVLGSNWSPPGTSSVNTYSWSGTPAPPGTKSLTATSNAAKTSPGAPFTVTADDTGPNGGAVDYVNGTNTGTTVSVTFVPGTDSGSGVGTAGLLQRKSATLSNGVCGTFVGAVYTTVANGTNPSSPVSDTGVGGNCYMYQYLTVDNVGNQGAPATSANVAKVPGAATKLAFIASPTGTTGGAALGTQPVVLIQDAAGNTTTGTDPVTLAITTPAGAALTCPATTTNAVSGMATFAGCGIDKTGTYTLTATSGALTGAVSTSFAITTGTATKLAFTTNPSGSTGGLAFNTQPVVTVQDAGGNTVTTSAAPVTLTITTPAGAALTCTANTTNAVSGVGTFAGCRIDKAGTYTLSASSTTTNPSLSSAASASVTVTAGTATKLAFTTGPSAPAANTTTGTNAVTLSSQQQRRFLSVADCQVLKDSRINKSVK
jgi:hypothetical protein